MSNVVPFPEKPSDTEIRVKPCPFCASRTVQAVRAVLEGADGQLGAFNIECTACNAQGPQYITLEGAALRWNRRDAPNFREVS